MLSLFIFSDIELMLVFAFLVSSFPALRFTFIVQSQRRNTKHRRGLMIHFSLAFLLNGPLSGQARTWPEKAAVFMKKQTKSINNSCFYGF
jgi:LytS/YehU family sensor histidine kinase